MFGTVHSNELIEICSLKVFSTQSSVLLAVWEEGKKVIKKKTVPNEKKP